ncbi:MAG: transposase, partial [Bacteroidaceae bacterium]|nr:transposase [Bacteroidaceae bacterium]
MPIIEINSIDHPGVEVFGTLTEAQLRNALEPEKGIFIAESPKVIHVALNAGYEPVSLLCEGKHLAGDAAPLLERCGDIPVYTGSREVLASLTGYTLTRGVLCAMRRPKLPTVEEVCRDARRIVVIHGVVDSTNIGAIFRTGQRDYTIEMAWAKWQDMCDKWGKDYRSIKFLRNNADYKAYMTYLNYAPQIQSMIYTTNWIERLNRDFRRVTRMR